LSLLQERAWKPVPRLVVQEVEGWNLERAEEVG